jgi:hypothetical protein
MRLSFLTSFLLFMAFSSLAQENVGINTASPDPSAALEISAEDKGLLIPRVADTSAVSSPAKGLLIYDLSSESFKYFTGSIWIDIDRVLADKDNDTRIQVEKEPDEDVIHIDAGGKEVMAINNSVFTSIGSREGLSDFDILSRGIDTSVLFQISNLDRTQFIRLSSGRQSDIEPFLNWQFGSPFKFAASDDDFGFYTEYMRINPEGKIGVNTEKPKEKLHVNGKLRVDTMEVLNYSSDVVVRDTNGNLAVRNAESMIIQLLIDNRSLNVQNLLDAGRSPIELLDIGVPLDSIYGKTYQGGLIFYLDTQDTIPGIEGLVTASADLIVFDGQPLPGKHQWGCSGVNLAIPDGPDPGPCQLPFGAGSELGDGTTNTVGIVSASCAGVETAAARASAYNEGGYVDWALPSARELDLIWKNLIRFGCSTEVPASGACPTGIELSTFQSITYWSSTEFDEDKAWAIDFFSGNIFEGCREPADKTVQNGVRPVRAF